MLSTKSKGHSPGGHHRQNSTPTISYSAIPTALANQQTEPGQHRRGLSLDRTITPHDAKLLTQQDSNKIRVETIFGQQPGQEKMHETQQHQHPMARPGQEPFREHSQTNEQQVHTTIAPRPEHGVNMAQLSQMMNIWDSTPPQSFDNSWMNDLASFKFLDPNTSAGYLDGFGTGFETNNFNQQFNQEMQVNEPQPHASYGQASHGTIAPGVFRRPQTPQNQIATNRFPMTPATTPFSGRGNTQHNYSRTADSSPTRRDPQLTIKASQSMQRGRSCQDNFTAMSKHAMSPVPSPPHTAPMKPKGSIDTADFPALDLFNMSNLQMDVPADKGGYGTSDFSPLSKATSSAISSFQSSPEVTNMSMFEDFNIGMNGSALNSRLSNLTETQSTVDLGTYPSPGKENAHQRSQSMSDLGDLEECVEDTGVTGEEIASFISGPDSDNKWTCLYSHCGKKFGRKENIKSHVQTHLGDRQFRCKQCNKCFVRQHDLKRHANIHTNARLYTCPCKKEFARHDALTRHRQRGMCIGAFEGTSKRIVKRGRPKKSRPETDERNEKAEKTRQRVLERMINGSTYASSSSASSVSHPSPPEQEVENVNMSAASPPTNRGYLPQEAAMDFLAWTPPTSPGFSASHAMSAQNSQVSHDTQAPSQTTSPMMFPELPMSRQDSGQSSQSHYSALPELELSSSSPAASRLIDLSSSEAGTGSSSTSHQNTDFLDNDFFNKDFLLTDEMPKEQQNFAPQLTMTDTELIEALNNLPDLADDGPAEMKLRNASIEKRLMQHLSPSSVSYSSLLNEEGDPFFGSD